VPREKLGGFTSMKWILSVIGIIIFTFIIGRICDFAPTSRGYASVYLMFAFSFLIAALLYAKTTDRKPRHLKFFSGGATHHERLDYGAKALWCYIIFYCCWAAGRILLFAFMAAFLMDVYHFSMTKLALVYNIQPFISILMLFIFGKVTDRIGGNRVPLIIVSGSVACAMFLWVLTPWMGLTAVIIYQILNGAAGNTHSMLAINLGLEIFPHKGRAAYLGFSRIFIGIVGFVVPIIAGKLMLSVEGFHRVILGGEFMRYHLVFLAGAAITLSCIIPLFIMGRDKVQER
jgi:predicted MFS family arabinose efflux permease